ncbi:MAG: RNA methyltransferase [Oscillospiraceae bacterium]|jgi:TrmH family RNA methyltransferase|nr:RNA methyltransferase [Oscillospiraceae bacterium]
MEKITSKDNRWVKEYAKLASLKSYRSQSGRFALEGVKLVCEAFQSGIRLPVVLVTGKCLERSGTDLAQAMEWGEWFLIPEELESKLTQQISPQGIYAIGEKLDKILLPDTIKKSGKYVMLCGLQDAGNVGTIIRTAEALGLNGVIATAGTCDFYNPKVLRGSMGSVFRMPCCIVGEEGRFLTELSAAGVQTCASVVDPGAIPIGEAVFRDPCVLLIGNEGNGLSLRTSVLCEQCVTIHMKGKTESLNASMAACILLWEMTK